MGTGYISDYTGNLTFMRTDLNFETDKQGLGVSFVFSNAYKDTNVGYGDGWNINYNKKIVYDNDSSKFYMQEADGNKVYFNYVSVEYPYGGVAIYKYISEDGRGLELNRSFYTSQLMSMTISDTSDNIYTFSTSNGYLVSVSNLYSITTTINRDPSIPEKINYVKDASDNYLRFIYDDDKLSSILLRTEAIETDPNGSETDYLEKVEYEYADYTDKLVRLKYLSDYDQDQDINIDVTVNYQYDAYERFHTGYISGGEEIIYYYVSNSNNSIKMIESFNDDEKFSEITYEYKFMQTTITDHTDNFVIYKFDQYGHTVNIIDKNANTVYYKYIDIFSDDTSEFYMEYIRNHEMLYESTPQKMTYNPIDNFSFESDSLTGWSISANISYEVNDESGFVGENCLELDDSSDQGGYAYQSISLNEGVYTFRASIYNSSGSSTGAYIEALGENTEPVDSSAEWQNISLPLYISHDETSVVLKLYNNTGGIVKYDNISIIEGVNNTNYNIVENASFEENPFFSWGPEIIYDYMNWYSVNDGTGDIDDTFESILGVYAYGIEGSPNATRKTTISIKRNYIDELDSSGKLYVGGWGNNYSSPYIGNVNQDQIFRITVDFYNNLSKVYTEYIDFDQGLESWQYVYKEIDTPASYTSIKISIEYQGLGEVIFDGITVFFEATEKTYDFDDYDRLERISYGEGTEYNFIYNSNGDRYPSEIRDKDNILLMTLDSDGSVLEYITQYNVTSTPTYNSNGQVTEMEITSYGSYYEYTQEYETSYFTTSTSYMWDNQYISSTTDEFGNITEYQTDEYTGLLEHIENSKDVKTQYEYYDNGMLYHVYVGESTSGTPYVKYEYDDQFRLVKIELDTNYYYSINYDNAGRMSSVQVNTNTLMSYSYKENEVNLINEYIFDDYNIYQSDGSIHSGDSAVTYYGESIEVQANSINLDPSFGGFIEVEPNTEYTVSAEILSITGSTRFNIFEYSGELDDLTYIGYSPSTSVSSAGELSKVFTTNSATTYVIIAFYDSSIFTIEFRDLMLDKNDDIETGILSSQTYGNGDEISFVYNNDGEVEYIRFTDSLGNETIRFHYLYDSYGRVSIYEDLINGTSESYEYDMQGRIVRVKYSNDDEILYGYDEFGNLNSVVYNFGTITSETSYNYETGANQGFFDNTIYDNGDNEIKRDYFYDDYGLKNLEQIKVILNGNTSSYFNIDYGYSTNKVRINTITYNFTDANFTDIAYTYTYDSLGNVESEVYKEDGIPIVTREYMYDDNNQLIQEAVNDVNVNCNDVANIDFCYLKTYSYDLNGNMTSKKTFNYIDTNYLVVEKDVQAYQTNYGSESMYVLYNNHTYSYVYSIDVGDNINIDYEYYEWVSWPPVELFGISTSYDYSNVDTDTPGYYLIEGNGYFHGIYDLDFGIVVKVGDVVAGTLVDEITFNYNTSWKDQLNSYTVVADGISTTSSIAYDGQGNPTQITNFSYMGEICDSATLTWEGRNLINITVYDSSFENNPQIDYTYNDQGVRIEKVITDDYGTTTYEYILSGDALVAEIVDNAFNNLTKQRNIDYKILYNYDFDGSLIGFTYYTQTTTVDYLYILNQLGDIIHIVDTSGNIKVEYRYDGYGNILDIDGLLKDSVGLYNSFRYRSYKFDNEIRMYYLNSRYYNLEVGRFINADGMLGQVGDIQTHNMYAYCANNPVMYSDITGYAPEWLNSFGDWVSNHYKEILIGTAFIVVGVLITAATCGAGTTFWAAFGSALLTSTIQVGTSMAVGVGVNGLKNLADGKEFFNNVGDTLANSYMLGGILVGGSQVLSGAFRIGLAKFGYQGVNTSSIGFLSPDKLRYNQAGMTILRIGQRRGVKFAIDLGRYGIHSHIISSTLIWVIPEVVGLIEYYRN